MSEQRYAILIASSRFPDEPKLQPLRCPEHDVDGFNEILTSTVYGTFTETCVLKNAPHYEVLRKMNQALKRARARDLVLVYYSGHGKLDLAGRLHLATVDTTIAELESTSIPVDSIRKLVDVSSSNQVVLMLDCCFSGAVGAAFTRSSVDDQLQLVSGGRGIYLLSASTGTQVALEKERDQYGVFTKHVIEGIRSGRADMDGDGQVTMDELYDYVHSRVLEEGFQEPTKWNLNVRGEVVIARSGKIPREERRQQIRHMLYELAGQGFLPDPLVSKAVQVLALQPAQLVGELRHYDELLDHLVQQRIRVGEFIHTWYQVGEGSWMREPHHAAQSPVTRQAVETTVSQFSEEGLIAEDDVNRLGTTAAQLSQLHERNASVEAPQTFLFQDTSGDTPPGQEVAALTPPLEDKPNAHHEALGDKQETSTQPEYEAAQQHQAQAEARRTVPKPLRSFFKMVATLVLGAAISAAGFYQLRESHLRGMASQLHADLQKSREELEDTKRQLQQAKSALSIQIVTSEKLLRQLEEISKKSREDKNNSKGELMGFDIDVIKRTTEETRRALEEHQRTMKEVDIDGIIKRTTEETRRALEEHQRTMKEVDDVLTQLNKKRDNPR